MESGTVRLKSQGALLSQAFLKFENEAIWHDGYIPNAEMGQLAGYRCARCRVIAFQYPERI
jgi:hypothetical protein